MHTLRTKRGQDYVTTKKKKLSQKGFGLKEMEQLLAI